MFGRIISLVGADFVDFHEPDSGRIARAADDGGVSTGFEPNQEHRFEIIAGREAARDDISDVCVCPPIVIRSELIAARIEGEHGIRQRRRHAHRRERGSHRADHYQLRSARDNEAADKLTLARPNQTTCRDVRHSIEKRVLECVDREGPTAGLEHAREHAVGDRKATSYRAGATDEVIERERVWSCRRSRRRYHSEPTRQQGTRALNHDDVLVRIDNKHHLTFASRAMRYAEVATGNRRIRAERAEAGCLEWLARQGECDTVFARRSHDSLARS